MRNKISTGRVESILRLDWANFLELNIQKIKSFKAISYLEAKIELRRQIGFTKDQINSHLRCENTVDIVQFYAACSALGVTYVLSSNGCGQFMATDSIGNGNIPMPKNEPKVASLG